VVLLRQWMASGEDRDDLAVRAESAVKAAMAVAPRLGEARVAQGLLHLHRGNMPGAMSEFRAALALSPSMVEAHVFLGELLAEAGRVEDALRRVETAKSLDPTMMAPYGILTRINLLGGNPRRAMLEAMQMMARFSARQLLSLVYRVRMAAYLGGVESLTEMAQQLAYVEGDDRDKALLSAMITVYLRGGSPEAVYELTEPSRLPMSASRRRLALLMQVRAEVAAYCKQPDIALAAIEGAMSFGLIDMLWLDGCPLLRPLSQEPGWTRVREALRARADAAYDALWTSPA
jgi:tetratricopeptide (TPR) repeat protein